MKSDHLFDVIIIGGSYAGLSAAMSLGRSLRRVLIIDSGLPCNRQTPHSHNFLTQDGKTPEEIAEISKEQVAKYPTIRFYDGKAIDGRKTEVGFEISVADGEKFGAKKLIIASGIKDIMQDIKGFSECWGISVIHCPYCHGYEFRKEKTGIIANGDKAVHIASLVSNLTEDVSILTSGKALFTTEQLAKLERNKIPVIETEITEIVHENGHLSSVISKDGTTTDFTAVYAAIPFVQHSDIPEKLGCALTESGHLQTDVMQKTNIPGVFACGDSASMMRSVSNAVTTGNIAGAMVNMELVNEKFG
ncbi:NAD(P)/FAD-dependent oxidoreductase [Elizabethkingia meningoseptica]|uniref:NAD(P)/FAD-dependent oxidoreductase n=1 Tax=Elizabethkingia meningoseptica TaxID=238 RepID=UPI0023B170C1|nr:NAD(P)/FAD-dependent oxidoreductase [Elizabethkingia meningoseptica]MDE5437507.1 NAD(P)/FAD-dependent oxidoreductase [Elizabethkingia meningoseptica]MDE5507395.1 NAD(P)/FAD-dependent oxidoreductase [Elizabethkingia meningoseptica]MDE5515322.1 NAD(P)/FAD-dependent oxidoreductase [Elizabethkingia meningoseptica]MDE5526290.1 NAD(P)/FAD-dependent oxidoreductase [Elizabethkingia meningoseptica]MDE5529589.1 NAD(P)/FAD-dependent oxidoreductase [Elizabethkingia meningoseptica]